MDKEKLRVYPISFEMEQNGIIEVTEREPFDALSTVRCSYYSGQ